MGAPHDPLDPSAALRHDLDAIAANSGQRMRGTAVRATARQALGESFLLMLPAPAIVLALQGLAHLFSHPVPRPGLTGLILLSVLPAAAYFAWRVGAAAFRPTNRLDALGALDHQLGLSDRLTTAQAFLDQKDRTPFMEAAIADARAVTPQALAAEVTSASEAGPARWWPLPTLLGAVGLTALAWWLPAAEAPTRSGFVDEVAAAGTAVSPTAKTEGDERTDPPSAPVSTQPPDESPKPTGPRVTAPGKPQTGLLTKDTKKTRGRTGAGKSADAATASGANDSRGSPTSQGQSSKSGKNKAKKKPKKRRRAPKEDAPVPPKKQEEQSGVTVGRGAASGSNRSPAASEWSSKDQVTSEEEEDLEQDEEVDDEFEDNEARGGLQPQLRDRKPPVNRDLSIGFGNQKSDDANGRGGQSEQKKSRGVASLVLGIPIPDHIKGKPNPGKTKITQERVEPRPENISPVAAEARQARQDPIGHLATADLLPWMRRLVRDYTLSLRSQSPNRK